MHFNLNIIPATIKALTTFVQVLDRHPRGAVMLILVMGAACGVIATAAIYINMTGS